MLYYKNNRYRKVPGDLCVSGFKPKADKLVNLKEKCSEGDKSVILNEVDPHYIESVSAFIFQNLINNNELAM